MSKKNILPYIMPTVIIIVLTAVIVIFSGDKEPADTKPNVTEAASETAPADNDTETTEASDATAKPTIGPTEQGTEVPEIITSKVEALKKHIQENGFDDGDGISYVGYMYGDAMYCSIRYDEESDMLCLQNSYYTKTVGGEYVECLAVMDNFPYLSSVEYYEDYYGTVDGDVDKANTVGTLVTIAGFKTEEITSETELTFYEMDTSAYEYDDVEAALESAGAYTIMSFSLWDEIIEKEFGMNLKDFGFTSFVRKDYSSEISE